MSILFLLVWTVAIHFSTVVVSRAFHGQQVSRNTILVPSLAWAGLIVFWFN